MYQINLKKLFSFYFLLPIILFISCQQPFAPEGWVSEEWEITDFPRELVGNWYNGATLVMSITPDTIVMLQEKRTIYLLHSIEKNENNYLRTVFVDHPNVPQYFLFYFYIITETEIEVLQGEKGVFNYDDIEQIKLETPYTVTTYPFWERHH